MASLSPFHSSAGNGLTAAFSQQWDISGGWDKTQEGEKACIQCTCPGAASNLLGDPHAPQPPYFWALPRALPACHLEAGDPGRARGKAGVGFNRHCQRTRIRCGFVSGRVYINQHLRYNLVNGFNSKRMLQPEKLSGARESVLFRKILLNTIAWLKYFDCARG